MRVTRVLFLLTFLTTALTAQTIATAPYTSKAHELPQYTTKADIDAQPKYTKRDSFVSLAIDQQSHQLTDYNPVNPMVLERYMTTLSYEYYHLPSNTSVGVIPVFATSKVRFQATPDVIHTKNVGIIPYIGRMLLPYLQGLIQVGAYFDDYIFFTPEFAGSSNMTRLHLQGGTYFGAAYLTLIGPMQPLSGFIRAGWIHGVQHMGSGVNSAGVLVPGTSFLPGSNFEFGGPSFSGRLKYEFNDAWQLYLDADVNYHVRSTPRPNVYRSTSGRQRTRVAAGPGVYYRINKTIEAHLGYRFVAGFGYTREHDILLRLRVLLY